MRSPVRIRSCTGQCAINEVNLPTRFVAASCQLAGRSIKEYRPSQFSYKQICDGWQRRQLFRSKFVVLLVVVAWVPLGFWIAFRQQERDNGSARQAERLWKRGDQGKGRGSALVTDADGMLYFPLPERRRGPGRSIARWAPRRQHLRHRPQDGAC